MMRRILDWAAAWECGPTLAGGKGWQLAGLAEMCAPVPPGFVISSASSADGKSGASLGVDLVAAVSQELEHRGWLDQPLAVRSSAVAEDSAGASFAGIHRSCLNVRGIEATMRAVRAVLDSISTPAATTYRQRLGISEENAAMAVIVMPLVPAIASGIAFTADPIAGREDRVVIHAHWGLGEALVGGHAEGDEYRLQLSDGDDRVTLIDQRRGSKLCMTVPGIEGTELRDTPADLKSRAVLSADQAVTLGKLVRDAATALNYANPCFDVEWVWDGKDFWIVQARPITARARYTYPALVGQPTIWSRGNSRDVVPDPLSPLDWTLSLLDRMLTQSAVMAGYPTLPGVKRSALRHGRLYFESSVIQWEAFDAFGVPPQSVNLMMGGHQPEISIPAPTRGERMARALRSFRYVRRAVKIRWRAKVTLNRAREEAEAWRATPPPIERGELARELRERLAIIRQSDDLFFLQVSSGSALLVLMDFVEKYRPGEGQALTAALLAGGEPSITAAQGYELMELARIASADPAAVEWLRHPGRIAEQWSTDLAADSPFRRAFTDFLARYGHRGVYETYLHNPRWREAPGYLLDSVIGLIGSDVGGLHQRQHLISSAARRRVAEALPFWYRPVIPVLIQFAVTERNLREGARSVLIAYLEVIRRDLLTLGKALAGPFGSGCQEDIFKLTLQECLALAEGDLPTVAAANRAAWRRKQIDDVALHADAEVLFEHCDAIAAPSFDAAGPIVAQNDLWHGAVLAGGHARSVACVARRPADALHMETGAVLVAPSTDPSWTPLFLRAGALVMETGGYLSHGAIVAREFGIPAIANLPGILDQIKNGDRLEVDGALGTVRRV